MCLIYMFGSISCSFRLFRLVIFRLDNSFVSAGFVKRYFSV